MVDISTHIKEFFSSLENTDDLDLNTYKIGELRENTNWDPWARKKGVYYFQRDGRIVYVGCALTTLGIRISAQLKADQDEDWRSVITDNEVVVGAIGFGKDNWFLAPALEAFLIDKFDPYFNKRIA